MAASDIPQFDIIKAASEGEGPIPTACREAGTFVHLHNHTEYSLLDGATRLDAMCSYAKELGMPAIAITDHGYMYGCAEFYQAAIKAGIKPILGCEVYFTPDNELRTDRKPELYHMILLAKTNQGYKNLMHLVSDAAVDGFYYKPRVTMDSLRKYHEGILATSACISGIIARSVDRGEYNVAKDWAQQFIDIFGKDDFYIELQDHGPEVTGRSGAPEVRIYQTLEKLAKEMGLKTVGTNDMHYLYRDDAYTQDLMLCIGTGKKVDDTDRMKYSNNEFYLKSPEEMAEALKAFDPVCMQNTMEIADKCNVTLEFGNIILPRFPLPEGETEESQLRKEAIAGLKERYGDPLPQEVIDRFEHEMEIICGKGFPAYFLVVQEFTRWAKQNGIGVGPGRGSAAGSIVSYALDITTFDPLENDLIFERFLSPERTEMPDIDMDFDDERRLEVVQHVRDIYGAEKIAHVITYGKMKAKQAVNDAARVLDYPVYVSQKISKMIPNDPKMTLDKALAENPDLRQAYEEDADTKRILDSAKQLEGLTRGEGVHASAVIICRDPVYDHVPVKKDTKGGVTITQYDGTMTANMGLLKMDFLGLRTLTVISKAKKNILANYGRDIDLEKEVDFHDPAIFELMGSGHCAGVFQIESDGMTALLKRMQPDCYSDIVATIALFRPGPLGAGMVDEFVERKKGNRPITFYDERLKWILEETYGTMVYQEQVMRISVEMCGFSVGESDKVRKAVAKKKIKLMRETIQKWEDGNEETMEDHWLNGAERNGYSRKLAQQIWDDVLKFAEYAFNKSHSAAYAILVMQTAWLKAHYPHEYMAAVLSSYMGKTDKIVHYVNACKKDGISVLPPDINISGRDFTAVAEGVRFGLAGLRGVGEKVVDIIVAEREENGPYENLHDFLYRMPAEAANKRVIEALIKAGAFDSTGYTRRQLFGFINDGGLLEQAQQRRQDKEDGQVSMFDLFAEVEEADTGSADEVPAPDGVEWERNVKLAYEKEMVGIYVSDHPLSPFSALLDRSADMEIADLLEEERGIDGRTYSIAGLVTSMVIKTSKNGNNFATLTVEDMSGSIDCMMWAKTLEGVRDWLEADKVIKLKGKLERSDRGVQIITYECEPLSLDPSEAGRKGPSALSIRIMSDRFSNETMARLSAIFDNYPGAQPVTLFIEQSDGRKFRAELPVSVNVASQEMLKQVESVVGPDAIQLT